MCGICGYALKQDEAPPSLRAMMDLLRHRGPDAEGILDDGHVAIGMRRLAVIDVAGGNQPIPNEDQSVWVILNGEIYNYMELRQTLVQQGHTFRTQSDTEVLVHLYEERGDEMLQELRGMFAVCIYDRRDASLLLARDAFGEKPLFYSFTGNSLVFASEVNSLLAGGTIPRRLDYEALGYYLRASFVPAPLTMFSDIRQLEPGCWMRWKDGALSHGRFWTPDYTPSPELQDDAEAQEAIEEAIRRAVSRQLVSERPLGAFLSGGIDSSTVVAFCQEARPEPIQTFTVGFEEASYDESSIARLVAEWVGTNHHEHRVVNAQFDPQLLWHIVDHVGGPFADSSAIPTYIISKVASRDVTVCLSGDGGDEMFGGYPAFRLGLAIQRLGRLPKPLLRQGERMAAWAAGVKGLDRVRLVRLGRRALQIAQTDGLSQFVEMHSLFSPAEVDALVADPRLQESVHAPLDRVTTLPPEAKEWSPLKCLMYYRLRHVLPEDMLVKVDRMSMSCSLEIRAPFLDLDLAKLAMSLPDKHLIRRGEQKYLLRQLARKRLPSAVLDHPKAGFSIPLHRIQNQEYRQLAADLLDSRSGLMELFSPMVLDKLRSTALGRDRDMADSSVYRVSHQLWALMQLGAWGQRFGVTL